MNIAINCRSILLKNRTGIGRYCYHLLDSLGAIDRDNRYSLHVPKRLFDFKRKLPDFSRYKNFKKQMDYWGKTAIKGDVYHLPSPDRIPLHTGKLIVTVHDLIYKTYPQSHTPQTIELTEKYMQDIVIKADHIICTSGSTRQDLHQYYQIPKGKTSVVHNGVDHQIFHLLPEDGQAKDKLLKMGITKSYVLYVGTIEPRKNLNGLLEAFAHLKSKHAFDGQLVVVGMKGWMMDDIAKELKGLKLEQDVIFTGFISDEELCMLYNRAEVFVFPSFYEGFGFPIVEAFCCGAAVITSNNSSCVEIAGDAAICIEPSDPKAIASAMERVVSDKNLRESLRQAGLKRAKEFSFEATARKTLDCYQQCL